MGRKLISLKNLWLVVALAGVLAFTGCSGDSPLAPDTGQEIGHNKFMAPAGYQEPVEATAVSVSQTIDPQGGGVIEINKDGYLHSFTVEKDAIDEEVVIDVLADDKLVDGRNAVVFEFGPDGLVFKESSKLQFEMADINSWALSARLYYFDPAKGNWVLQDYQAVVGGYVIFDINHFSKYAISD